MMDERLSSIVDPDRRMVKNVGTKDKPNLRSRIAELGPTNMGFQRIKRITHNGQEVAFKVDGTILEVVLHEAIQPDATARLEIEWTAHVPEQIRRSGRNSAEGIALSMAQWCARTACVDEFGWHLDGYAVREFVASFGDFDVTISVPEDCVVGVSGVLQNPLSVKGCHNNAKINPVNDKGAWHFKAENIHD